MATELELIQQLKELLELKEKFNSDSVVWRAEINVRLKGGHENPLIFHDAFYPEILDKLGCTILEHLLSQIRELKNQLNDLEEKTQEKL